MYAGDYDILWTRGGGGDPSGLNNSPASAFPALLLAQDLTHPVLSLGPVPVAPLAAAPLPAQNAVPVGGTSVNRCADATCFGNVNWQEWDNVAGQHSLVSYPPTNPETGLIIEYENSWGAVGNPTDPTDLTTVAPNDQGRCALIEHLDPNLAAETGTGDSGAGPHREGLALARWLVHHVQNNVATFDQCPGIAKDETIRRAGSTLATLSLIHI